MANTALKHYEELKRAWTRLHAATADVLAAFNAGDTKALEIATSLVAEAMDDIVKASKAMQESTG